MEIGFYENKLFAGLDNDAVISIEKYFSIHNYASGDVIIEEGSTGDSIYLLLQGVVTIDKNLISLFENLTPSNDDKQIIDINSSTHIYFGEISLFDKKLKRTASVISKTDTVVAKLTKDDFYKITKINDKIAVTLLFNIAKKLTFMLDRSYKENSKLIAAFTLALK